MPPKTKGKGAISSSTSAAPYDRHRFWNATAVDNYNELLQKGMHKERGMSLREYDAPALVEARRRGWELFVRSPPDAVMSLVREFYANLMVKDVNLKVRVRGQLVAFDRSTINTLYGLPDIENDEYQVFKNDPFPADAVLQILCHDGAEWKKNSKDVPVTFMSRFLQRDPNNWHEFVAARMLPSGHTSDVTKARASLVYCIVTGKSVDVGRVLQDSIIDAVRGSSTISMPHSSLITTLCGLAGVVWDADDEPILHIRGPIPLVATLRRDKKKKSPRAAEEPSEPLPHFEPAPTHLAGPMSSQSRPVAEPLAHDDDSQAMLAQMNKQWRMMRAHMTYMHDFTTALAQNYPPTVVPYPTPPQWSDDTADAAPSFHGDDDDDAES